MCYRLYLLSPLTLSEIRSMLPLELRADLVPPGASRGLLAGDEAARTAVTLSVGECACRFVADPPPDESTLRTRYRAEGVSRDQVIAELARHRRQVPPARPAGHWLTALAAFVAEHARNAGPSLYTLHFGATQPGPPHHGGERVPARAVLDAPGRWLKEAWIRVIP